MSERERQREAGCEILASMAANAIDVEIVIAAADLATKMQAARAASIVEAEAHVEMQAARKALGELLFGRNSYIAHPEDPDADAKIEAFAQGIAAMIGTLALSADEGE